MIPAINYQLVATASSKLLRCEYIWPILHYNRDRTDSFSRRRMISLISPTIRSMRSFRLLLLVGLAGITIAQAPSPFQQVGSVSQLMVDIIYPTSDALFYIERDPPKNDHDWNVIRGTALTLAESGNLLLMGSRARDQDRWVKDTKLLIDAGAAAFRAAQKKDMQAILDLNEQLSASCTTCHRHYRPN
jgi:hypothetical protein